MAAGMLYPSGYQSTMAINTLAINTRAIKERAFNETGNPANRLAT